ncbi:UNVERIFIED_CONTAM: Cuticle protein 16.8 [Trichonephila clavipes]
MCDVKSTKDPCPHYPPQPYGFGYEIKDHLGNQQYRKEHSDGKKVIGSYGYTDAHGIHRLVDYVADEHGFRAKVRTNEPGTANQDPANVRIQSSAYHGPIGDYH